MLPSYMQFSDCMSSLEDAGGYPARDSRSENLVVILCWNHQMLNFRGPLAKCLLGTAFVLLAASSPVELGRRAPAIAATSDTLHLQRHVRHGAHPTSRIGFKSLEGVVDYKSQDRKPVVADLNGNTDFVTAATLAARQDGNEPIGEGVGPAINAHSQVEYITPVSSNGDTYSLIIDTGSSDTWFVREGFQCLDYRQQPVPYEACQFGPAWQGDFPGGKIPNKQFQVRYGSSNGPFLTANSITVANITVETQEIAHATYGMWFGDGLTSGILGLGLRGLTGLSSEDTYDPVAISISKQTREPIFSLALHRDESESFIAFGGVPPQVKTTGPWATTPIQKLQRSGGGDPDYYFYTVLLDQILMNNTRLSLRADNLPGFIVDSGTTLNYFPFEIAVAVNNLFDPPAILDSSQGAWFVPCTGTTAPSLGITLGGTTLWTDSSSMILPEVKNAEGLCATGISATDAFPYILGDTFMQNIVTVFDLSDKMEIRYAQRDLA
ncbi:hypothetical protein PpBr36_04527 [Pyricularia pennisetigena]|uniref:hypothetical protein n=1 Tax=Pyricularia pennisetigena TaxID=1578925 RepID=UPI00114DFF9D|nr:hypothetical protein PpBr36_04527 [Pyricularia pennisetigena]TLS26217.1 hypothetical protein PpBr36_04527 [Pyricularia pennisetigena]